MTVGEYGILCVVVLDRWNIAGGLFLDGSVDCASLTDCGGLVN